VVVAIAVGQVLVIDGDDDALRAYVLHAALIRPPVKVRCRPTPVAEHIRVRLARAALATVTSALGIISWEDRDVMCGGRPKQPSGTVRPSDAGKLQTLGNSAKM